MRSNIEVAASRLGRSGHASLVAHALDNTALIERKNPNDDDDLFLCFRISYNREIWLLRTTKQDTLAQFALTTTCNPGLLKAHEAESCSIKPKWIPVPDRKGRSRLGLTIGEIQSLLLSTLTEAAINKVEHPDFPIEQH
jgi:hypothetical protein